MGATPNELRSRWETRKGQDMLRRVVTAAVEDWRDWSHLLEGLDHVDEVRDRRDLRWANLSGAELDGACFMQANLSGANLKGASLVGAFLNGAALEDANLSRARLSGADLRDTDLAYANLSRGSLQNANLRRANLKEANLREAVLNAAHLQEANLTMARLSKASLANADLSRAVLKGAELGDANLRGARLLETSLEEAFLTGINIYQAIIDGWRIERATCDYLYYDPNAAERIPKGGVFGPGEFEQLYASRPTVRHVFESGMSPLDSLLMTWVVESIHEEQPELELEIAAIDAQGLAPSITFTLLRAEDREAALTSIQQKYEAKRQEVAQHADRLYELAARLIEDPSRLASS